jgi:hypothetical protein
VALAADAATTAAAATATTAAAAAAADAATESGTKESAQGFDVDLCELMLPLYEESGAIS